MIHKFFAIIGKRHTVLNKNTWKWIQNQQNVCQQCLFGDKTCANWYVENLRNTVCEQCDLYWIIAVQNPKVGVLCF